MMRPVHPFKILIAGMLLSAVISQALWAEDSPVNFPEDFARGVMYFKNDRGSITEEVYVNQKGFKAAQSGQALPSGTVITLVEYFAKSGKGSDGYANKGELKRYVVMEKRTGWGKNRPLSIRNGEWEYQAFNPDKSIQKEENLERCLSCHISEKSSDYVYTLDDMRHFEGWK